MAQAPLVRVAVSVRATTAVLVAVVVVMVVVVVVMMVVAGVEAMLVAAGVEAMLVAVMVVAGVARVAQAVKRVVVVVVAMLGVAALAGLGVVVGSGLAGREGGVHRAVDEVAKEGPSEVTAPTDDRSRGSPYRARMARWGTHQCLGRPRCLSAALETTSCMIRGGRGC